MQMIKQTKKLPEIEKNMAFSEILFKYPETLHVFLKYGMHCIGCPMAMTETIDQGAKAHGINVDNLIKELNSAIRKKK
jgi:hybrid cluster-associated redox disulfide protein